MTVYLNTRYKAPTPADQFIVVRTRATKWAGRKAFTEGTIENLDGKVLVEADALYVEPRVSHGRALIWNGNSRMDESSARFFSDLCVALSYLSPFTPPQDAWLLKTSAVKEALGEAGFKE